MFVDPFGHGLRIEIDPVEDDPAPSEAHELRALVRVIIADVVSKPDRNPHVPRRTGGDDVQEVELRVQAGKAPKPVSERIFATAVRRHGVAARKYKSGVPREGGNCGLSVARS